MKKILLTRCAGFIGSNFVKKIATKEKGYKFIVHDALTYARHYSTIAPEVEGNDNISFFKIDVCELEKVDALFKGSSLNGVIHFAAESQR